MGWWLQLLQFLCVVRAISSESVIVRDADNEFLDEKNLVNDIHSGLVNLSPQMLGD